MKRFFQRPVETPNAPRELAKPRRLGIAPLLLVALLFLPGVARADTPECERRCSVNRNCSSTGVACDPLDRDCTNGATAKGLEVKCEQTCPAGTKFVYCPADAGRGDSSFVWVLLALSGVLAVGGGAVAFAALRRKA